jgi:hypothetical protein
VAKRGLLAVALLAVALAAVAGGCGSAASTTGGGHISPAPSTPVSSPSPPRSVQVPAGGIFGPRSVWKQDVSRAPVAANSAAEVQGLAAQVSAHYGGTAAFNIRSYNLSFYSVPAAQPVMTVHFSNCQNKPQTPAGLYGPGGQFEQVPVPNDALPAQGRDSTLSIYRASTDTLWELWRAHRNDSGWHACWGGRLDQVSRSPGYFSGGFGSGATGLAGAGGAVTIHDVQSGRIDHALSLAIIAPGIGFSWPAQRGDGLNPDPQALVEGTRLRLPRSVDVNGLGLTPIGLMIARAAQTYGFIVTNRSGAVSVAAESGGPTEALTGSDPWPALLGGTPPFLVMQHFPWSQLQALPRNYGR